MTSENPDPSDDGLVVTDPAGEKFRIRWAKRGTLLRSNAASSPTSVSDAAIGVGLDAVSALAGSGQKTWKVAIYKLIGAPKIRDGQPNYRERLRAVYKERLPAGTPPGPRVAELQALIEQGALASRLQPASK